MTEKEILDAIGDRQKRSKILERLAIDPTDLVAVAEVDKLLDSMANQGKLVVHGTVIPKPNGVLIADEYEVAKSSGPKTGA